MAVFLDEMNLCSARNSDTHPMLKKKQPIWDKC